MKVGKGESYLAVQRFDRPSLTGGGYSRIHVHTSGNLSHANFRIPSSDYGDLLKVTAALTRNHQDVLRVVRQRIFNIDACNRDDHAKNFAFVISDAGEWSLSPAYDLTFAAGPGGEHTMTLSGEGRTPILKPCLDLARGCGIKAPLAKDTIEQVFTATTKWTAYADQASCPKTRTREIGKRHAECRFSKT